MTDLDTLERLMAEFTGLDALLPLHTGPACDLRDGVRTDARDDAADESIGTLLGLDYGPSDAGPLLADLMVSAVNALPELIAEVRRLREVLTNVEHQYHEWNMAPEADRAEQNHAAARARLFAIGSILFAASEPKP